MLPGDVVIRLRFARVQETCTNGSVQNNRHIQFACTKEAFFTALACNLSA